MENMNYLYTKQTNIKADKRQMKSLKGSKLLRG